MRWLIGLAAGICAGIAILAAVYGLNKANDWYEHRTVALATLAVLEGDPGYPNRESNIKSEREQIEILDREVKKSSVISALVLIISIGGFVPLWRTAARSFTAARLAILVAITAAVFLLCLGLALVMLSAGVIRG
jgi:hypothetical protein